MMTSQLIAVHSSAVAWEVWLHNFGKSEIFSNGWPRATSNLAHALAMLDVDLRAKFHGRLEVISGRNAQI